MGKGKQDLDFDSDEKDAEDDGANAELISLDNVDSGKKKVPKLRKPQ